MKKTMPPLATFGLMRHNLQPEARCDTEAAPQGECCSEATQLAGRITTISIVWVPQDTQRGSL
jgi:hypothetical protein